MARPRGVRDRAAGAAAAAAAVFARLFQQLGNPQFLAHAAITLFRLFCRLSPSRSSLGVALGLAATGSRAVGALLTPLVRVLAPVPKVALYPAFILILGFDHASKIALVVADAMFPILLATYQGASAVEPKLVWSARAAGTSQRARAVHGRAAGGAALGAHRLPHRARHLLHRGVPGRDDHLDRRARAPAGARRAQLPDRRHVRAADRDLDLGLLLNAGFNALRARLLAGFRRKAECSPTASKASGSTPSARCSRNCAVKRGDTAAILSETQSRPLNVHLAELALLRLGARPFHVVVPTPRNRHPVPVRSTGASEAIGKLAPVVAALGQAGFVVDCTIEGLMHAPETPAILKAGARILVISNEHPEALERMRPDPRAGDARARGGEDAARAPSA